MTINDIALGQFARTLINRKVRRLAGYGLFTDMDWADLQQELIVRLLHGLRLYDPARPPEAFVVTVLERAAAVLVRERMAEKRNTTPASLDTARGLGDEPPAPANDPDLGIDTREMLAALPLDLRAVAELLMNHRTISEAARTRGIRRTSFARHVERLRRYLEDAGLADYVG